MSKDEEWLLKEKYLGKKTDGFFADCSRLEAHEPLAYIIGSVPFLHTTIYLDSKPLIPRTETEYWVEKIIFEMKTNSSSELSVLDLCAGSGCVGIAVLKEIENSHVDFTEIDMSHHATIKKNLLENNIDILRAEIFGGDLFEKIVGTYDYILTNPPYIDPELNRTSQSVQKFEPDIALYGGTQGTEIIFRILAQATQFLKSNGVLVVEHEPEQVEAICAQAEIFEYVCITLSDQFGIPRYTVLTRK